MYSPIQYYQVCAISSIDLAIRGEQPFEECLGLTYLLINSEFATTGPLTNTYEGYEVGSVR